MTYGEAISEWAKTGGKPVAVKRNSEGWKAWELYFHQFDLHWALALMFGKETWTVPAEHPAMFDSRFNPEIGMRKKASKEHRPSLPINQRKAFVAKIRGFDVGDPDAETGNWGAVA